MFSDPHTLVTQMNLLPGMVVADLGAGIGSFSFPLAARVAPAGKVYACEIQKDMITRLNNEIHERHISNIQTIHANIEAPQGTRLRDASIDWVVIANVFFQIEKRDSFIQEVFRILKPGGKVLLVDWSESFGNLGPLEQQIIRPHDAEHFFTSKGFMMLPQVIQAGAHHYGIIFEKK